MARYFLDTEFVEDGQVIDLLSIGIICNDGTELYLQSAAFSPERVRENPWVMKHVVPHLTLCPHVQVRGTHTVFVDQAIHARHGQCVDHQRGYLPACPWRSRDQLAMEVARFIDGRPEAIYGWCAGYDFVALCQLFGTMMELPPGWPHYLRDLQYLLDVAELTDAQLPPQPGAAHHALEDARYIRQLVTMLEA